MSDYLTDAPVTEDRGGMLVHHVKQGTEPWYRLRAGRVTCSSLHRVITPTKQEYSGAARAYIVELLTEQMLGEPLDWGSTDWTQRGTELEPDAVAWYCLERGVEVELVGCIERDGLMGSPDALVKGQKGGAEIKVPGALKHMENVVGLEDIAKATQVQGLIRVADAEWWDAVSWNPSPKLPNKIHRIYRDDTFQKALTVCLAQFHEEMAKVREKLAAFGDVVIDEGLTALLSASIKKKKKAKEAADIESTVEAMYGPKAVP